MEIGAALLRRIAAKGDRLEQEGDRTREGPIIDHGRH